MERDGGGRGRGGGGFDAILAALLRALPQPTIAAGTPGLGMAAKLQVNDAARCWRGHGEA